MRDFLQTIQRHGLLAAAATAMERYAALFPLDVIEQCLADVRRARRSGARTEAMLIAWNPSTSTHGLLGFVGRIPDAAPSIKSSLKSCTLART